MTEGPGTKDAPHPFTDEEPAPGHDLFGLGERDRQAVLDWVGSTCRRCGGRCMTSDSCTGAWGSGSWLVWPLMSVGTCSRRR
jgi:hypothetical protein